MLKATVFSALVVAFIGLICGWNSWRTAPRDQALPVWRGITSGLGLSAMTAQTLLLVLAYVRLRSSTYSLFDRWWFLSEFILFVSAVLLIATEKSTSKWWLFASSSYFFLFCFLVILDT
jgi:phosphoglycerol transferase MdoB-like AlkP superfamily enzyme